MLIALLVACSVEGPPGPAGPQGPPGPTGETGPEGPAPEIHGLAWFDAEGSPALDWPEPIAVDALGYVWAVDPEEARLRPVADLEAEPLLFEAPSCGGYPWVGALPLPREVVEIRGGWRARRDAQAAERVCPSSVLEDGVCRAYDGPCVMALNVEDLAIVPAPGPPRWAPPLHLRAR